MRPFVASYDGRDVARREGEWPARQREVALDGDPAAARKLRVEGLDHRVGAHAGRPDDGTGGDELAVAHDHAGWCHLGNGSFEAHLHAMLTEHARGVVAQAG